MTNTTKNIRITKTTPEAKANRPKSDSGISLWYLIDNAKPDSNANSMIT